MTGRPVHIILHGKAADRPDIAAAMTELRRQGRTVEVTPTSEARGARPLARSLAIEEVVVVAAGGDGTINETAAGLLDVPERRAVLAVLPAGTANDFARGCTIPEDPLEALWLAAGGVARPIDVVRVGTGHCIVNCGTAVFTADPVDLPSDAKRMLGGAAYWVQGVLRTLRLEARALRWRWPGGADEGRVLLLTVANGVQTGGGARVAADAKLDDGLFDVRIVRDFPILDLPALVAELADPMDDPGGYIARLQVPWFEVEPETPWSMTVDGEDLELTAVRFEIMPRALAVVLPETAPLLDPSGEVEQRKLPG